MPVLYNTHTYLTMFDWSYPLVPTTLTQEVFEVYGLLPKCAGFCIGTRENFSSLKCPKISSPSLAHICRRNVDPVNLSNCQP